MKRHRKSNTETVDGKVLIKKLLMELGATTKYISVWSCVINKY